MSIEDDRSNNFIQAQIEADLASGRYGGRVATRFPPEPNGYLHIGHAKSICLNFGLARKFGGTCNLRYDDTNPTTESAEYVASMLSDIRWLGFEPDAVYFASDYYEQLYQWAEKLIRDGKAYVDDAGLEALREARGTVHDAGVASVGRDRPVEENLRLFREMRAGVHADGAMVLRAKIDLAHVNMKMRDPLMYRIRRHHHYRTGDAWCIYPMYDWAHGQCDAIERITHSICTLEFDNNRELYDWFLAAVGPEAIGTSQLPNQYEFARLNLTRTVMSKRKLLKLVNGGYVDGWDDPRMPTIAGLRRKGVTASAIRNLCETIGVARAMSTVDVALLDHAVRDDLNPRAPRRMAVLAPLRVVLTNWGEEEVRMIDAPSFPPDVGVAGSRAVPLRRELLIEREDFQTDPPPGFFRLRPGGEVRLRYAAVIRCDSVEVGPDGEVALLRCTLDRDTFGSAPQGRTVKGTIHWVPEADALPATAQLFDDLVLDDDSESEGDFLDHVNPRSRVLCAARVEPAIAADAPGGHYQFERHGYFYRAPEDASRGLVFNRTVALKDSWERAERPAGRGGSTAVAAGAPIDARVAAEEQASIKAAARAARLLQDPALAQRYQQLLTLAGGEEQAFRLAEEPARTRLFLEACGVGASGPAVAAWMLNALLAERKELGALPFDGAAFGRFVTLVEAGRLTSTSGKAVLAAMLQRGEEAEVVVGRLGLDVVADEGALAALVDAVVTKHAAEVVRYRAGEVKLMGFFTGLVIKASRGSAKAEVVQRLLKERLGG